MRKSIYLARVRILLIMIALISGMAGCGGGRPYHNLYITSTAGGSVTRPGENTFIYYEGTVVNLEAEAEEGYRFVNWSGNMGTISNINDATTNITINGQYSLTANFAQITPMAAAGGAHTVGLKSDSTVVAVGDNTDGQCDVDGWTNITQIAAGMMHTVGLESDGTVVAVGDNTDGQCDVVGWTDIIQVAAGGDYTVGLKSDGTVVAVGRNDYGQCDVDDWTDIIRVTAGFEHTVGIKSDGTVVAVGDNTDEQCELSDWDLIE
jgi:alpha-tubulin suppressor-like RCC1 family protein